MEAVVVGNVTLDVICFPVDAVPRHDSIRFERTAISPGGCGSNVAVGLAALAVETALVAYLGDDEPRELVEATWARVGLDTRYVRCVSGAPFAVSVGLVDRQAQPRFIHTSGANAALTAEDLRPETWVTEGARALHIGGYFVLPRLMGASVAEALARARSEGLHTSLDVVDNPQLAERPDALWPCLPHLDVFLCNEREARRLTGERDPQNAAKVLQGHGASAVVIKVGQSGCWLFAGDGTTHIPAAPVEVVDTTGAGDAFAAGLIAARLQGDSWSEACRAGNRAGGKVVSRLGAVTAWLEDRGVRGRHIE